MVLSPFSLESRATLTLELCKCWASVIPCVTGLPQGSKYGQLMRRVDEDGLKQLVEQGLVYYEREERDLHMLLFPEVLDQVRASIDGLLSRVGDCIPGPRKVASRARGEGSGASVEKRRV